MCPPWILEDLEKKKNDAFWKIIRFHPEMQKKISFFEGGGGFTLTYPSSIGFLAA